MLNHLLEYARGSVVHGVCAQAVQNNVIQRICGTMQGPRGSASLWLFHSILSGTVQTVPTSALGVRGGVKGRVAVARVDMGKERGMAHAGAVSGAWGHVDEPQDVWAGRKGS